MTKIKFVPDAPLPLKEEAAPVRIHISGGLGTGKTSLALLVAQALKQQGLCVTLEDAELDYHEARHRLGELLTHGLPAAMLRRPVEITSGPAGGSKDG